MANIRQKYDGLVSDRANYMVLEIWPKRILTHILSLMTTRQGKEESLQYFDSNIERLELTAYWDFSNRTYHSGT